MQKGSGSMESRGVREREKDISKRLRDLKAERSSLEREFKHTVKQLKALDKDLKRRPERAKSPSSWEKKSSPESVYAELKLKPMPSSMAAASKKSSKKGKKKGKQRFRLGATQEMESAFEESLQEHRRLVQRNIARLVRELEGLAGLLEQRGQAHEVSKYSDEERLGFVLLAEQERSGYEFSEAENKLVAHALQAHASRNRHHPLFHVSPDYMSEVDLAELVCCWAASEQSRSDDMQRSPRIFVQPRT